MYDLRTLSTANLFRLYHRVWARMTAGDGYQPFGYDLITLELTRPGWLAVLWAISTEFDRR